MQTDTTRAFDCCPHAERHVVVQSGSSVAAVDIMGMIAAERRRIADLIDSLSPEELNTPSLCGSWTVKQVVGHLVSPVAARRRWLVPLMLRSGFNFHKTNALLAVLMAERSGDDLATLLRDNAENPFRLPIFGHLGQLTDLQVHGQDIRRPLGLPHDLRPDPLRASLDFLVSGRAMASAPKGRRAGLRFAATDLDWAWGSGPVVQGTAEAVMLALTGRPIVLGELDGDGVMVLRERVAG